MKNNINHIFQYLKGVDYLGICILALLSIITGVLYLPSVYPASAEHKYFLNLFQFAANHPIVYTFIFAIITIILSSITYGIVYIHASKRKQNRFTAKEVQTKFIGFMGDASPLYIFGGDLDFLLECSEQLETIKSLGSEAYILCSEPKDEEHVRLYHSLKECGIRIRQYSMNTENEGLRGQIRTDRSGRTTGLFINKKHGTKEAREYELLDILNGYMTEELRLAFRNKHETGRHPTISLILFDLGGVYFDGDFFRDFLEIINRRFSQNIQAEWSQKMMLDESLNLGTATIFDWVEKQFKGAPRKLNKQEKEFVKDTWTSVWTPNQEMEKLVASLRENNYEVGVVSNLDKMNGDNYFSKGYFNVFSEKFLFLSYQMKKVKPHKDFFYEVLEETKLQPYQILIIDDHNENIKKARELGFYTITFSLGGKSSPENLKQALKAINICYQ